MTSLFPKHGAREALEQRWKTLTNDALPSVAPERRWPIHLNHCFQRVLLDAACGTVWYDVIKARPAYRAAPDDILKKAVQLGENVLDGKVDLAALNEQSLRFRGKL